MNAPASERPKILVLGGYARSLVNFRGALIARLASEGCEVVAAAPEDDPEVRAALGGLGARFVHAPLSRTGMNPFADLRSLLGLAALFRREKPGILLAYTVKPVVYGSLAARLAGVPRVFSMITGLGQAFAGESFKARLVGRIVRTLYALALSGNERVFFQNPDDRDLFLTLGLLRDAAQPALINGSGVDVDHFRPAPLPAMTEGPVFLLIARLLKEKGVREYVQAARLVKRRHPEAVFRLAGWIDGGRSSVSAEELEGWRAEGTIEWLGRLEDVRPAIAGASVFVLPSFYPEGTPRSSLEAMAMGRAVITTDAPGCRETVRHGDNGLLVPVRDAAALAEAMERLIEQPGEIARMGGRSRAIAEERFDVHKVNDAILEVLGL